MGNVFGKGLFSGNTQTTKFTKNKELKLSIPPQSWLPAANTTSFERKAGSWVAGGATTRMLAPIVLPQNATIISAIFYATVSDKNWKLRRLPVISEAVEDITPDTAYNSVGVVDKSKAEIDNLTFSYHAIINSNPSVSDNYLGGVINYSVPIDFADEGLE